MYAFIDAEKWAEDGHPDLSEQHSFLHGTGDLRHRSYGFLIVDQDETDAMTLARGSVLLSRDQLQLPFASA